MAFATTVTARENLGSVNMVYGTYTNAATDSGGTITTPWGTIVMFGVVPTGSVEETLPKYSVSAGVITIVTPTGSNGNWFAAGK